MVADNESPKDMDNIKEKEAEGEQKLNVRKSGVETCSTLPQIKITPPFPHILKKNNNNNAKFLKFVDIVKDLKVNIPLVDALTEMSGFARL